MEWILPPYMILMYEACSFDVNCPYHLSSGRDSGTPIFSIVPGSGGLQLEDALGLTVPASGLTASFVAGCRLDE